MIEDFKRDVDTGLSAEKKSLPSKYFYNKIGDELFVKIMNMPEYYLTNAEHEIFIQQTSQIIDSLKLKKDHYFELIELGAGDGTKTKELLNALCKQGFNFDYMPIDISQNSLNLLQKSLKTELPRLSVKPKQGMYFKVLESLKTTNHPKVILFLGSNLGNLEDEKASEFIYQLGSNLKVNDRLLLGVDLIKSKNIIFPAYNDPAGITKAFNLNLLQRINDELGGNFSLPDFNHAPEYNENEGIARSYIVSLKDQTVTLKALDKQYHFKKGERIYTEISRKYNDAIIKQIIQQTDFEITHKLSDSKGYFADYILERK